METPQTGLIIVIEKEIDLEVLKLQVIKCAAFGDDTEVITAIALTMVKSERIRDLINRAGKMANQIRRGEIDLPDINVRHN
jgi:hypothetical protein